MILFCTIGSAYRKWHQSNNNVGGATTTTSSSSAEVPTGPQSFRRLDEEDEGQAVGPPPPVPVPVRVPVEPGLEMSKGKPGFPSAS